MYKQSLEQSQRHILNLEHISVHAPDLIFLSPLKLKYTNPASQNLNLHVLDFRLIPSQFPEWRDTAYAEPSPSKSTTRNCSPGTGEDTYAIVETADE